MLSRNFTDKRVIKNVYTKCSTLVFHNFLTFIYFSVYINAIIYFNLIKIRFISIKTFRSHV